MPLRERVARVSGPVWVWAILPLLLAAALVIPLLDADSFNGDEPSSLLAAGLLRIGEPHSFQAVWDTIKELSPEQALGWPMLLSLWVRIFGWSEPAIRSLSLFAGLLALAWVYRAGRDFFSARAGLFATLLFSASVFLHTYMAHARAFTLIALFAMPCLWCYWRLTSHPRPSRWASAGLLLGAAGLLWSHYIGALLLPVLGLYHLLFAPRTASHPPVTNGRAPVKNRKTRRWWWPVLLLLLAALSATPQLSVFERGLGRTVANEGLRERSLSGMELFTRFLQHLSNGLVNPSPPDEALLIFLPLALLLLSLRMRRAGDQAGRLLAFASVMLLTVVVLGNAAFRFVSENRVRYLMPLWPMTALLAGAGLHRLAGKRRRLVAGLLALWLVYGAWLTIATEFRNELGWFRNHPDSQRTWRAMRELIPASDLVVIDKTLYALVTARQLYLPYRTVVSRMDERLADLMPLHTAEPSIWLLYNSSLSQAERSFIERDGGLERILCERVLHPALDEREFRLERYDLHTSENCPDSPVRLEFDGGIRLIGPRTEVRDGQLLLDAHFHSSDDEQLLANYSLAVHIIDRRTGERVAQDDTGVGPGSFVQLRSEIDVSALPAGEYVLRVALYNWQSGARLSARDLETGASSDMHTLQRIRVG